MGVVRVQAVAEEEWSLFDAFPDLTVEPDEIVAEDSMLAVRWTATGTHQGDFRGIAPTGVRVEYQLMGMFRVEGTQVTEVWLVADGLALLQQLGAVEALTGYGIRRVETPGKLSVSRGRSP